MGRPTIKVEIAFASNPYDATYTWTDVSAYVRVDQEPVYIRRGRQYELGQFETGEAVIPLDNRDRRFDPTYTSGAYYPNVVPAKPVRITATWSAVDYVIFLGYVDAWPPTYQAALDTDSITTIRCSDGFKFFNLHQISGTYSANYGNDYMANILNDIGWPAALRELNITGTMSQLAGATLANSAALSHMQTLADSENGQLYMSADGNVVWEGRHFRLRLRGTSSGTFGDSGAEIPYTAIEPIYDDTNLYNDIRITRSGGTEQIATDSTSITSYRKRTYSKTGLLITTNNEALDSANWKLLQYKDPHLRFKSLTVDGNADDAVWPHALGREISDHITVRRRPPGGGATIEQECYIEAVEHRVGRGLLTWATTWQLSPVDGTAFLTLDDATLGRLNYNALAY